MPISDNDREKVAQNIRHTKLVDASRKLARIVKHVDPPPAIKSQRTRLEKDLPRWLKHHGGEAFASPWSADHERMMEKIASAVSVNKGGMFAFAMPRGHGKTTLMKWSMLYAMLTGQRKYIMVISATDDLAHDFLDFAKMQLLESESLYLHYPHVCEYIRKTEDKAIKARHQLWIHGERSGITWSVKKLIFPSVTDEGQNKKNGLLITAAEAKPYPCNGAILEVRGLTGAIRGKTKDHISGEVLRPEFVILDDPQTGESAESTTQCNMRERRITGDVLGLAGPKKRIAAVMPCTIIRKGDLADRFLDHKQHPEWQGETCRLINVWPAAQDTLWKEYERIYREETGEGRGFGAATEYYKAHQTEMDAGAEVSWKHRVRDGEISALQTAENLLIETGPQFWAEYQNEPKDVTTSGYKIEPAKVAAHQAPLNKGAVPDRARILVAATDINRSGLCWVVVAFDQQMSAHVCLYGRYPGNADVWPENAPALARAQGIFKALTGLSNHIAGLPFARTGQIFKPSRMLIDRGYEPDAVHKFCQQASAPFRLIPCRGFAASKYGPRKGTLVGAPFENCHITESPLGQYIAFNADAIREIMQRAWLGDAGMPGGATLYRDDPRQHIDFSEHICAEILRQKYQTDGGTRWEWSFSGGPEKRVPNDWADAMSMAYVGAASAGLNTQGVYITKRPQPRRMPKVRIEE
jgi:hypothetical protein